MIIQVKSEGQRIAERRERERKLSAPHPHFTVIPVRLENGNYAVMQMIWRRGIYNLGSWVWLYNDTQEGF